MPVQDNSRPSFFEGGMIANNILVDLLLKKYPSIHGICTDKALYDYVITIKNEFMHKTQPLRKVLFESKI